jgi:hypothetical protein
MSTALAVNGTQGTMMPETVLEMVTSSGDLGKLTATERASYITALCHSMGLNALSRPIELISLNGKTIPYAKKDCTDQLRKIHRINIEIVSRESVDGVYTVTARATTPEGRTDEDVGSVTVMNLKGDNLANATMRAHTKAKRRVTLSIVGLGILDESELDTVAAYKPHADTPIAPVIVRPAAVEHVEAPAVSSVDDEVVDLWRVRFEGAESAEEVKALADECKHVHPMSDATRATLLAISPYAKAAKSRFEAK